MLMRFIAVAIASAMVTAAAPFELPRPSGAFPIGTTSWTVTDPSRAEPAAPREQREVRVVAWYPTDATGGTRAPYLREGADEARVFEKLLRAVPGSYDAVANVETHAFVDTA